MAQRTYHRGEPEMEEGVSCRIDDCGAHAVMTTQGKGAIVWCREGHISIQVWTEGEDGQHTYEWVAINENYPWE